MRSIRTSLLVYLLPLLAVAVGLSLYVLYENQRERSDRLYAKVKSELEANDERDRQLQEERCEADRKALENYFNDSLRLNALSLARQMTRKASFQPPKPDPKQAMLMVAPLINLAAMAPTVPGLEAGLIGMRIGTNEPQFSFRTKFLRFSRPPLNIKIFEGMPASREEQSEFYQITDENGAIIVKSNSLKGTREPSDNVTLPTPSGAWNRKLFEPVYEDVVLPSGFIVRQLAMRVPVVQVQWDDPTPGPGGRPRRGPPLVSLTPADQKAIDEGWVPVVMFHYARPLSEFEEIHSNFRQSLEDARRQTQQNNAQLLASQAAASQESLLTLRGWVIGIGAVTIAAILASVIGLVHLGLRPVRRITDAVSQVNERDFELKLEERDVPSELAPVVGKLKESLNSLGDAFTREKQAAADISHELRTPIAAMLATAQVCLRKQRSSEEYKEALGNCVDIGKQLQMLVERLLTLARIDAGSDPIRPEPVDVPELANQCVNMVKPLAEARGLQLTMERNGPAESKTDPNKLREIVINLLHNAIQYNKPNGSIGVAVHRNNGHVHLEVHDTGVGISDAAKPRLFERFFRADPSRQADTVHAGLGLSIVKGYVDLMGGSIEVDSVEGEGSTFRVILPAESVN